MLVDGVGGNWEHPVIGRCIFCKAGIPDSDEHIVPKQIGGSLQLKLACCPDCRKMANDFESRVFANLFGPVRKLIRIQAHDEEEPCNGTAQLKYSDWGEIKSVDLPLHKHPMLFKIPAGANYPGKLLEWSPRTQPSTVATKLYEEQDIFHYVHELEALDFYRYMTKIAYCYVWAEFGWASLADEWLPFIRGDTDNFPWICYGKNTFVDYARYRMRPVASKPVHVLRHELLPRGHYDAIRVHISLFASLRFPEFYVTADYSLNRA